MLVKPTKSVKKITHILLVLGLFLTLKAQAQENYKSYCNSSYMFCMSYPQNLLVPQEESPKGDGREFLAKTGKAKITTWGNEAPSYAIEGVSDFDKPTEVKSVFEQAMEGKKVSYKVLKNDWFVISGTDAEGNIFYQRTQLKGLTFITVLIAYPSTEKTIWDKECGKIAGSLKFQ